MTSCLLSRHRRAKGLCFKCGEKWSPTHKCPTSVSLHVLEEVWQFLEGSSNVSQIHEEEDDLGDDLMAISIQALQGTEGIKTIRLRGFLSG